MTMNFPPNTPETTGKWKKIRSMLKDKKSTNPELDI